MLKKDLMSAEGAGGEGALKALQDELDGKNAALEKAMEGRKKATEVLAAEVGELKEEVALAEGEVKRLKEELEKTKENANGAEELAKLKAAAEEASELKEEVALAEGEVKRLKGEVAGLKEELEKAKAATSETEAAKEASDMNSFLSASSGGNPFDSTLKNPFNPPPISTDATKALDTLKEEHEETLEELGLAVEEVKRLKKLLEVEKEKAEIAEAIGDDDKMKQLEDTNAQLKKALSVLETESKAISSKFGEEQKKILEALDAMEGDLAEAREETRCAEEEVHRTRKERDALMAKLGEGLSGQTVKGGGEEKVEAELALTGAGEGEEGRK